MAQIKKKKKVYNGKNIRISNAAFERIKAFVDMKGLKLGRFVEAATLKEVEQQTK